MLLDRFSFNLFQHLVWYGHPKRLEIKGNRIGYFCGRSIGPFPQVAFFIFSSLLPAISVWAETRHVIATKFQPGRRAAISPRTETHHVIDPLGT